MSPSRIPASCIESPRTFRRKQPALRFESEHRLVEYGGTLRGAGLELQGHPGRNVPE